MRAQEPLSGFAKSRPSSIPGVRWRASGSIRYFGALVYPDGAELFALSHRDRKTGEKRFLSLGSPRFVSLEDVEIEAFRMRLFDRRGRLIGPRPEPKLAAAAGA